jgi:hypothetical protein
MEFLKKHYEKILLGVVLLGLAAVVVFLFLWISSEKQKLEEKSSSLINRPAKPIDPLKNYDDVLQGASTPPLLDFSATNRLFNPVKWQKAPDGRLIKINRNEQIGPKALTVTNITPLYMTVSLETVQTNETGARYAIIIEHEAATTPALRRKRHFVSFPAVGNNNKTDVFVLIDAKGQPDDPELTLALTDTGDKPRVSKSKPFKRVDVYMGVPAYMADLKYDPEKMVFKKYRVGMPIAFGGEEYNIVAISDNEVVISAKSNNKKTTITYVGAP